VDENFVPPKYLTPELVEAAMDFAYRTVLGKNENALFPEENPFSHSNCHIVVLVPALNADDGKWPNYLMRAHPFQKSFGEDRMTWKRPYDEIAQCKAYQLWTNRNNGQPCIIPQLLFRGDTPFWGGVCRDGIVVACSGQPQHIDRLISGIADTIQALAVIAYESDPDHPARNEALNFLT